MPCWLPWKQWQDLNVAPFFFALVAQGGSLTKAAFCAQVCVAGPVSLLHHSFAIRLKGSAGTLRQGIDPAAKHSYEKGSCSDSLQQQHRGSNFHLSFHGMPREGKHKSLKTLALACIHNTGGKKRLCTWMSGAMGSETPSHSPGDPSSACSMMQLTSTTSSAYPQYWSVATKPDLDCLRWAQVKPLHQGHL